MRELPLADPGTPDLRSPTRLLLWVARGQVGTLAAGTAFGVLWMGAQAVTPTLVGRAIDLGVAEHDIGALLRWSGLVLAVGVVGAVAGILRHRVAVTNWLTAAYRVQQLLVRHAVRLGGSLPRRISTGEVVSVGSHDVERIGGLMDITARLAGAVVSFGLVAVLMLRTSMTLGLVVLVGVPLVSAAISPLLRPLHDRQARCRELVGALTTVGADTVSGLRVLRGIGGEAEFSPALRRRVPGGACSRRGGQQGAVAAGRRPGRIAGPVRRRGHLARRTPRGLRTDQRGRAGRLLRLRGVPGGTRPYRH
jgi:ABC-type multidrug transport system fused ATPase/permease subunit